MVKLDILSDPICPWCYIGKTNLDRALEKHPDHPFEIEWHPFQLNPKMPEGGMDRREYLELKFGGQEGAISVYSQIEEASKAVGLAINYEGITKTPNTMDAHRLIHWAGLEGRQTAVVSRLFLAYFVDGKDIGDQGVLLDIAQGVGMDRAMTQRLIESDADRKDIRARDIHARQRGVTGVPTFVVGQQHVVAGAQPPDLWTKVIADLVAAETSAE